MPSIDNESRLFERKNAYLELFLEHLSSRSNDVDIRQEANSILSYREKDKQLFHMNAKNLIRKCNTLSGVPQTIIDLISR